MGALRSFQSNMEVMITMKKLFKKSIACLIAVLMVFSTMPLSAFAADLMDVTENVVNGNNYSLLARYGTVDYFCEVLNVYADGNWVASKGNKIVVPEGTKKIEFKFSAGTYQDQTYDATYIANLTNGACHYGSSGDNYSISTDKVWTMTVDGTSASVSGFGDTALTGADKAKYKNGNGKSFDTTFTYTNDSGMTAGTKNAVWQYKVQLFNRTGWTLWRNVTTKAETNANLLSVNFEIEVQHNYQTDSSSAQAATCTKAGKEADQVCSVCGDTKTGAKINELGHSFTNYVSNNDATCTADGTKTAKCDRCDVTDTITDVGSKLDHSFTTYTQTLAPTCTTVGKEEAVCDNGCGTKNVRDVAINENAHNYGAWVDSKNGKTHTRTCLNNSEHTQTEVHNIVNGACTECGYVAFDMVAYDKAVAEYNALKKDPEYATKYTSTSITEYESLVDAEIAKGSTFATQEEVDAAAAAILSAKTKLVYAQPEIKFVEVDANGIENVIETKNYTYGTPVEFTKDADNIAKWIVKTQNGKVETKVATSQTTYTMIATEPATVYVHLTEEKTEALEYSKVSFISKNGAVSFVQYVAKGTTIETIDVPGVKIPFYKFMNWDKASVTADGNDIEVKAVYEFIGTVDDKCNVHYDGFVGGEKEYTYDSFVYLFGAEDKTLALSTDGTVENIITYLNENAFYAPHTKDIYVIVVDSQQASIGITGSYSTSTDTQTTYAFNCKLYVPADCTVVEYGLIGTAGGVSKKIRAEKASDRGEFTVKITASGLSSMSGKAYLTYKTADGDLVTIYSTTVTQA